ncbi:MAG: hypothetical protein V1882_11010 [Candidatus Omnitrophota bacterium]
MKLLETSEPRGSGKSFVGVLKGVFVEFACWIRKGLSLGVMLFLAFTTLSFLNRGAGYLEASLAKTEVRKQSEAAVPSFSRGNVNVRQAFVGQVSGRVYRPAVIPEAYSPKNTRDTLRESGYLVNELESFARTLARFGR